MPKGVLKPGLVRIHLDSPDSFGFYREQAKRLGWKEVRVKDLTPQLVTRYTRVPHELERQRESLARKVSDEYIARVIQGPGHWIDAGTKGFLAWGILHFRKLH